MLDLTTLKTRYMEMKMIDGKVLQINKPNQRMIKYLSELNKGDSDEQLQKITDLSIMIINNNREGIVYKAKELEKELNLDMMMAIIESYMKFIKEVLANPN